MNLIRSYFENTSLHGFADFIRSKNGFKRLVWALLICTAFGGLGYEIYMVISDYNSSPLITVFEIKSATALQFPVVQICPQNFINASRVRKAMIHPSIVAYRRLKMNPFTRMAFTDYMDDRTAWEYSRDRFYNYGRQFALLKAETYSEALENIKAHNQFMFSEDMERSLMNLEQLKEAYKKTYVEAYGILFDFINGTGLDPMPFDPEDEEDTFEFSDETHQSLIEQLFPVVNPAGLEKHALEIPYIFDVVGVNVQDQLMECFFAGSKKDCNKLFETVFDPMKGRCFLFKNPPNQTAEGIGLDVIIDLKLEDECFLEPEMVSGVSIKIATEYEPISFNSINVPPGTLAQISLHGSRNQLEAGSAGACVHDVERTFFNTKLPYSDSMCRAECVNHVFLAKCSCIQQIDRDFLLPQQRNIAFCQDDDSALCQHDVLKDTTTTFANLSCLAKCKPSCNYWDYAPVVTYFNIPSLGLTKNLEVFAKNHPDYDGFLRPLPQRLKENIIYLKIAFEKMQYKMISQKTSMTPNGFVSQIGGLTGLFVGASLLSAAQLLMFFAGGLFQVFSCDSKTEVEHLAPKKVKPKSPAGLSTSHLRIGYSPSLEDEIYPPVQTYIS